MEKKDVKTYDIVGEKMPKMPKNLPPVLKLITKNVPDHMRPAIANSVFPALGALMHDVRFRYADNVCHEPHFMCGMVGAQAVGKGCINPVIECIIHSLREHDAVSREKLQNWQRICRSLPVNRTKPDRPTDAAILAPEPDMTNPALVQNLMDAEAAGNRFMYTNIPELDQLDECCGSHTKVTKVIRLAFDISRYGAHRATVEGVSGTPLLRWNFNFSCVPQKAKRYFRYNIQDGTLSRVGLSYIPRPEDRTDKIPRQGDYDQKFRLQLDAYLIRLQAAQGEIECAEAIELIRELAKEMCDIAVKSGDENFADLSHRALVIAWLKGCVLYVAGGYEWTKQIEEFVRWSLYYDLWSKEALFAARLRELKDIDTYQTRQNGPQNLLEKVPEEFSYDDLVRIRVANGKTEDGTQNLLNVWRTRKYIELIGENRYRKLRYLG